MPMNRSLLWRLTLAFLLVAIATAALVALFIRVTSVDRLTRLIADQQRSSFQESLAEYYAANGSWDGLAYAWQQDRLGTATKAATPPGEHGFPYSRPLARDRRRLFGLADAQGTVILAVDPRYPPGSQVPPAVLRAGAPVFSGGKQVGTVLTAPWLPGLNPEESLFLQRTNEALVLGALVAILVALAIGLLLARTLIRPLQALTHAARNIARGQLEQQVNVRSKDEIGQLAEAFNRMSREVARSNQARRQMTADIAHDLRTPLTVIAGYIESMQEGVLQPTPERFSLIYAEIQRLQRLVEDLRMLSQADAGELSMHPQPISPGGLLARAAAVFQHRAGQQGVALAVEADGDLPQIRVDEVRMMRVLDNLVSNALRYTPAGGKVTLSARQSGATVTLTVADTGIGIPAEDLPYIFERFRRADRSRHTEAGESGLGLAIVKALAEAHGGSVAAESTPGKGTSIHLVLPAAG